jgi:hypothetical protein
MHIKTLTAMSVLLVGIAACNNPKPADPAVTTPAAEAPTTPTEAVATTNAVDATMEASNAVAEPAASNGVEETTDDPRGLPDRRGTDAAVEGATEAK